jgi:hypothetical protein
MQQYKKREQFLPLFQSISYRISQIIQNKAHCIDHKDCEPPNITSTTLPCHDYPRSIKFSLHRIPHPNTKFDATFSTMFEVSPESSVEVPPAPSAEVSSEPSVEGSSAPSVEVPSEPSVKTPSEPSVETDGDTIRNVKFTPQVKTLCNGK